MKWTWLLTQRFPRPLLCAAIVSYVTWPLSLGRDCRCCNISCRRVVLDCGQQLLVVSGDVAWHISGTIVCTNGNHDLLDLGIAGACAYDVGQLYHSCTSNCFYMGVACGVNTSSGDVFEIGVPNYQSSAGVGQTESWGGEQAGPAVVAGGYRILLVTCVRRRCRCMTGCGGGRWWWVLNGGGGSGVLAIVYCCVNALTDVGCGLSV